MGVNEVTNFILGKLKELLLAMENLGGEVVAWFDKVFPPETRGDKIHHWIHVATPFLVVAAGLILFICFCHCCCGCCDGLFQCFGRCFQGVFKCFRRCCCCCCGRAKMMKAPGRNYMMPRSIFESDPRGYFQNLRAYPGDQLC